MAEHDARTLFTSSHGLIDLTQSDDEDKVQPRLLMVRQSPATLAQKSPGFPVSNHGFLLSGAFTFGIERGSQLKEGASNVHKGGLYPRLGSLRHSDPQGLKISTSTSFSMPASVNASLPYSSPAHRIATVKPLHTAAQKPQWRSLPPNVSQIVANTAKRRKVHRGMVSQEQRARTVLSRMQEKLVSPPSQQGVSVADSVITSIKSNLVARIPRQELSRDPSRIYADNRIKEPHSQSSPLPLGGSDDIFKTLFKYINRAQSRYHGRLSSAHLREIGKKTARRLVDPEYLEDLTSNKGKLSVAYEKSLEVRARIYVDKYATEVLKDPGTKSQVGAKRSQATINVLRQGATNVSNSRENLDLVLSTVSLDRIEVDPSVSSTSDGENGEVSGGESSSASRVILPNQALTFCPLSPLPPFSNLPTRSVHKNHTNDICSRNYVIQHSIQGKLRRSTRSINLQKSLAAPPGPPSLSNSVPNPLAHADEHGREYIFKAMREVQSLRFAGLDLGAKRPYINWTDRDDIRRGLKVAQCHDQSQSRLSATYGEVQDCSIIHLDFCLEEIEFLSRIMKFETGHLTGTTSDLSPRKQVMYQMADKDANIPRIVPLLRDKLKRPSQDIGWKLLQHRDAVALTGFLQDAAAGRITEAPQLIRFSSKPRLATRPSTTLNPISSLLREREVWGKAPTRALRGLRSFKTKVTSYFEDCLVRQSEWTDCCGDVFTLSWTSGDAFICGATAHSDLHNMQYNKPGNLLVGSTSMDTLRAIPDHRIIRPIVSKEENAENSSDSMRQTQDPWLYTSVVSTSHSEATGFSFTGSFDKTVKVWEVPEAGSSMYLRGIWEHEGKVNFVVTSSYHELVATASDVSNDAIRVYHLDEDDVSRSRYDTYTGDKAYDQAQELRGRDTWAYFPATIQWGRTPNVAHLLLVGYSPRSVTAHENDIPDDKKNSGELCLWNVENGTRVSISSARSQNVFEVIWHPTQPCFLAATSPCGTFEPETRTQVRLFAQNEFGAFLQIKALDCPASDINELTIVPNSIIQCYITASCTDGNTYVWDTAQGDAPVHVLGHGDSLDNPIHDIPREIADTGVKFASWGKTSDRFYTGSSDGKVKAWDIRAPEGKAFVRDIIAVSGGISVGAFSKDFSRLLLGDSTGKIHLLGIDDLDPGSGKGRASQGAVNITIGRSHRISGPPANRPKVIIPHPEPEPPVGFGVCAAGTDETAKKMARHYLEQGQLTLNSDRTIGAVQGPNYNETELHCREGHVDNDSSKPLLPEWQAQQQYKVWEERIGPEFTCLPNVESSDQILHVKNLSLDFDISSLPEGAQELLEKERVDLDFKDEHTFDYELLPRSKVFKDRNTCAKEDRSSHL